MTSTDPTSRTASAGALSPESVPAVRRVLAPLRTPVGVVAAVLTVLLLVLAAIAPVLWSGHAELIDADALSEGPSSAHPMGTDDLGRDILYRVLVATRLSIGLALLATALGVLVGTVLGTAPSALPRPLARIIVAGVNIAVAFPALLLALFFAVIFGVGTTGAVMAVALAMAPSFARLAQTLTASVDGRDFVAAARVAGVGRARILVRHVLPNIADPLIVNATIAAGAALLAFAGLSFLGIGVQPPDYDWGRLLDEGLSRIYVQPAAALAPAVAVIVSGLAFSLLGESAASAVGGRVHSTRPRRTPEAVAVPAHASEAVDSPAPVLDVRNLRVSFPGEDGWATPVRGVDLRVGAGEAVGVVGESGSGKSLTALAVAQLIESPGEVVADRMDFAGTGLLNAPPPTVRRLLGTTMAMVFQDPMTSFNPALRIGRQLAEVAEQHLRMDRQAALSRAVDRLGAARITDPEARARLYPHQLSGGMRQRAMIGMGLMGSPRLVIADEPTTALDVTVQRQVLRLLDRIRTDEGAALVLISHDLAVIAQTCDRMLVMYAGRVVEELRTRPLTPRHPYTSALLRSVPDLDTDPSRPLALIEGRPPEPGHVPAGCAFAPRCPVATARCREEEPVLTTLTTGQRVACWHPEPGSTIPQEVTR